MALKKGEGGGGLADYVHGKDAAGHETHKSGNVSRDDPNDDLKVPVRGSRHSQPASSRQPRAPRSDQFPHNVQVDQARLEWQTERNVSVWNAGDSSIGDSSETPSALECQPPQASAANSHVDSDSYHAPRPHANRQVSDGEPGSLEEGGENDVEVKGKLNILQDLINGGMSQDASNVMKSLGIRGPSFPHVPGDSYPSTTSGPSSIQATEERQRVQYESEEATHRFDVPTAMPVACAQQPFAPPRSHIQNHVQQPYLSRTSQNQAHNAVSNANRQLNRPAAPEQSQQVARNFDAATLAKAGQTTPNNGRGREVAMNKLPRQPLPVNEAVPKQTVQCDSEKASRKSTQDQAWQPGGHQQQQKRHIVDESKSPTLNLATGSQNIHAAAHAQSRQPAHDDVQISNANVPEDPEKAVWEESPIDLDYDTPELQRMDFGALKRQSFDVDPRQDQKSFPGMESSESIDQQMEAAAAMAPDDQHEFLATLPIDEWEQAGEWFLGRFSGILSKLKSLRQEKRKAALAFEDQIEGRHAAVAKKRKATEAAFAAMRTSGMTILESTPKKASGCS